MIKEALQWIVEQRGPLTTEIKGETYTDKALRRVAHNPKAEEIKLHTLTSLMDYIKSKTDTMADKMVLHVVSPTEVRLCSQLDDDREMEYLITVMAELPHFEFGRYLDHENFCIALQSKFINNEDRTLLLKFAGTVEAGSVAQYSDDGVSQKATVKKGIASKEDALIPNPVLLKPYRTFLNIDQPESKFIFHMREDRGIIECAIFEADGGAWKDEARKRIHTYLECEISNMGPTAQKRFVVMS